MKNILYSSDTFEKQRKSQDKGELEKNSDSEE